MDNILSSKIVSAILKKAVPRKAALPILETVHFDDGFIEATDLDVTVRIPYSYPGVSTCLPAKDFIENIDEAFKLRTLTPGRASTPMFQAHTTKAKR
jgi:hypothetical protein